MIMFRLGIFIYIFVHLVSLQLFKFKINQIKGKVRRHQFVSHKFRNRYAVVLEGFLWPVFWWLVMLSLDETRNMLVSLYVLRYCALIHVRLNFPILVPTFFRDDKRETSAGNGLGDHPFSTYAKFSEKLTFLHVDTHTYVVYIRG